MSTAGTDPALTPILQVRDTNETAVIASRWTLTNAADRDRAVRASLEAMPSNTPGLVSYSVYRGLDDLSLFHLSQWSDVASRDHYVDALSAGPRDNVDTALPEIDRLWRELAVSRRSYASGDQTPARCLVVVRQPMRTADPVMAMDWVDTVIAAIESDTGQTDGLVAATFLINTAGDVALNLAEWVNADAHRAAILPADFATQGSLGDGALWRATREHPGPTPDHEVLRYALAGVVTGVSK